MMLNDLSQIQKWIMQNKQLSDMSDNELEILGLTRKIQTINYGNLGKRISVYYEDANGNEYQSFSKWIDEKNLEG